MIKVEITDEQFELKQGTSSKTGKPYAIREQDAWGYFYGPDGKPHPHPMRIRITLGDQQEPYKRGLYQISPASFYPDRFGQVTCRVQLVPLVASQSAPRAA